MYRSRENVELIVLQQDLKIPFGGAEMSRMDTILAFRAITQYAIDSAANTENKQKSKILRDFKVNEKLFFKKMYVERRYDKEIKSLIEKDHQMILISGYRGVGKTSIVGKVLFDLKEKTNAFIIRCDFKEIDDEEMSRYEEKQTIHEWITEKVLAHANKHLREKTISIIEVVKFFFLRRNKSYLLSNEFENIRSNLYAMYSISDMKNTFYKWFTRMLETKKNRNVFKACIDMSKQLRARDLLYFLTNCNTNKPTHCVIWYDNIDSIIPDSVRKGFFKYIRKFFVNVSHSANIILCTRTNVISDFSFSDFGAFVPNPVEINYREFIDDVKLEAAIKRQKEKYGFINDRDIWHLSDKLEYKAKEKFSNKVINKRTGYIIEFLEGNIVEYIVLDDLEYINTIRNLFTKNNHIYGSLFEIANHDRRLFLQYMNGFIKYCLIDLNLEIDSLGKNEPEKIFALESYFYQWVVDLNIFHKSSIYDIVGDLNEWEKGNSTLGCCLQHLIIATIYNLTNKRRGGPPHTTKTTIRRVIYVRTFRLSTRNCFR